MIDKLVHLGLASDHHAHRNKGSLKAAQALAAAAEKLDVAGIEAIMASNLNGETIGKVASTMGLHTPAWQTAGQGITRHLPGFIREPAIAIIGQVSSSK